MEKDHQPDSMATVAMKPDYPPSEGYSSSEPPPAYRQPRSTAVQVARIVAFTVILSSMVLGGFLLAASYVQARAGCQQLDQLDAMLEKELAYEARMQAEDQLQLSRLPPLPLALRQDAPAVDLKKDDALLAEEPVHAKNEEKLQSIDDHQDSNSDESDSSPESSSDSSSSSESGDSDGDDDGSDESGEMGRIPIRITLPLQLDFDDLAGALIEKNQRSRMNCVVEKRKNEELVDHQARSLQLPFGLNLTTAPRLQRVTGERMAIFCESGDDNNRDMPEGVEVLSGFPVPLGGPVRLPLNFPIHQNVAPAFRPPMPAQHMQAPAPQAPQDYQNQQQEMPQRAFPPQFVARHLPQFGPQPPQQIHFQIREQQMPQPQSQHMPFQIREQMPPQQNPFQMREQEPQQQRVHFQIREEMPRPPGMFQMREQSAQEQQIPFEILQRIREITQSQGPAQEREQQIPVQFQVREQMPQEQTRQMPFQMREQNPQEQEVQMSRIPMQMALVPREVRIHVQRIQLPQVGSDQVPQDTHVSQEEQTEQLETMPHPLMSVADLQAVQQAVRAAEEDQEKEQREHQASQQAEESREARNSMMERQAMARALPVNIPVSMMIQEAKEQESRPVVQDPERPHYVQPRSVRSARSASAPNPLHREKRVKRCTCDCNC